MLRHEYALSSDEELDAWSATIILTPASNKKAESMRAGQSNRRQAPD
jgi:hypothetical protein